MKLPSSNVVARDRAATARSSSGPHIIRERVDGN